MQDSAQIVKCTRHSLGAQTLSYYIQNSQLDKNWLLYLLDTYTIRQHCPEK